jgi:hypothetical protein
MMILMSFMCVCVCVCKCWAREVCESSTNIEGTTRYGRKIYNMNYRGGCEDMKWSTTSGDGG